MIEAIFSRVSRYASAEASRNANAPRARIGITRKVSNARWGSITNRITITPRSISVDWNSVARPSEISWSSASTSLVIREMITPARLRE